MRSISFAMVGSLAIVLTLSLLARGSSYSGQSSIGGIEIIPKTGDRDAVPLDILEQYIRLLHENVQKKKVEILGNAMEFTPPQAAKFWPIYSAYTSELQELQNFQLKIVHDYMEKFSSMDDQTADGLAQRQLHFVTRRTALIERYYGVVRQQLDAKVAARFLQVETRLIAAHDLQIAAHVPLLR